MTCGVLTTMHSNIISIRLMNQALVKGFENSVKNQDSIPNFLFSVLTPLVYQHNPQNLFSYFNTTLKNTAAENTPAGEKPQPQQVKEAQQTKPDQSAPVQVSDAAVQIAAAHQYCHMTS